MDMLSGEYRGVEPSLSYRMIIAGRGKPQDAMVTDNGYTVKTSPVVVLSSC